LSIPNTVFVDICIRRRSPARSDPHDPAADIFFACVENTFDANVSRNVREVRKRNAIVDGQSLLREAILVDQEPKRSRNRIGECIDHFLVHHLGWRLSRPRSHARHINRFSAASWARDRIGNDITGTKSRAT